jgi:hypothetical protein
MSANMKNQFLKIKKKLSSPGGLAHRLEALEPGLALRAVLRALMPLILIAVVAHWESLFLHTCP